jgi:hypothetical protein
MKGSCEGTAKPASGRVGAKEALGTSVRKVAANRQNALKSTGPKTLRGKAHSRRNAIMHGLFIKDFDAVVEGEDPRLFDTYYKRLRDELKPVGPREESEVEYIAICWRRLQRVWRYENAEIVSGTRSVSRDVENGLHHSWRNSKAKCALMSLLQTAGNEVEAMGCISPETMESISAHDEFLALLWPVFEKEAEKTAHRKRHDVAMRIAEERKIPFPEAEAILARDPKCLPERQQFVAFETVMEAKRHVVSMWFRISRAELENEYQRRSIPDDDALDKIVRYGNACERQLSRSYERLDQLQTRRRGEAVPPPMRVRLTH